MYILDSYLLNMKLSDCGLSALGIDKASMVAFGER